ncbi:hypothetical protein QTP70_032892 [Hemibagrus guttatus]|uniref:O(6)-methylguanine-induced apoptosis 2 n=1 Tax=Hemibagrus guttatus TaxID=175788 RepID=A0AAE0UYG8_9TELE|nr:hypothetical protein QTP70_032892 [Hemibagrus guttatus]
MCVRVEMGEGCVRVDPGCLKFPSSSSIPSKYQTVIISNVERKGFSSQAKRFTHYSLNENPGPGSYLSHTSADSCSPSFSKKGTGGFVSKALRVSRKPQIPSSPAPNTYNLQSSLLRQHDFNRDVSRTFHLPIAIQSANTRQKSPAPNQYKVSDKEPCTEEDKRDERVAALQRIKGWQCCFEYSSPQKAEPGWSWTISGCHRSWHNLCVTRGNLVGLHHPITPPHYTTTLHHHITPPHYTTSLHHHITPPHYTSTLHHPITPPHYTTTLHHLITPPHYTTTLHHLITPPPHYTTSLHYTGYSNSASCHCINPVSFSLLIAGHYNVKDTVIQKTPIVPLSCFKSTSARIQTLVWSEGPGPGSYSPYNTPEPVKRTIIPRRHYLGLSAPPLIPPKDPPLPGPGQYEIVNYTGPHKHLMASAAFKSSTCREPHHTRGHGVPGPGSYEPDVPTKRSFLFNHANMWIPA